MENQESRILKFYRHFSLAPRNLQLNMIVTAFLRDISCSLRSIRDSKPVCKRPGLQARVSFNSVRVSRNSFPDRSLRHANRRLARRKDTRGNRDGRKQRCFPRNANENGRIRSVHRRGHFCNRGLLVFTSLTSADTRPNSLTYYFARRSS